MKVLQFTNRVPFPPTDGGAIGIFNITKGLFQNGCTIDLLSINTPKHSQPAGAMKDFARQFDVFADTTIKPVKLLMNLVSGDFPYNVERFYTEDTKIKLSELITSNSYDFIQLEGTFVASYIPLIKSLTTIPIIIRAHNVEYVIWERLAANEKNPLKKWYFKHISKQLKAFEAAYYNQADGIAAITEEDKQRLLNLGVLKPIHVIPAGVDFKTEISISKIQSQPNSLFFIGALDWMPNLEGLNWFLENVWPELNKNNPEISFHIAGKSTPDWLKEKKIPGVFVHGFVDDAAKFMSEYDIMLVPLLSGGGMRVKIIEGLAAEKCIISSSVGAEGIQYMDRENILIADQPEAWISAITFLLNNPEQKQLIARNARKLAEEHYENKAVTAKYITLFERVSTKKSIPVDAVSR